MCLSLSKSESFLGLIPGENAVPTPSGDGHISQRGPSWHSNHHQRRKLWQGPQRFNRSVLNFTKCLHLIGMKNWNICPAIRADNMWLQLPALCGVENSQQDHRQVWPWKWKRRHHRHDQIRRHGRLHCSIQGLHGNRWASEGKCCLGGGRNQRLGAQGVVPSCHAAARPSWPLSRRFIVIYFKTKIFQYLTNNSTENPCQRIRWMNIFQRQAASLWHLSTLSQLGFCSSTTAAPVLMT